uniref:RNA-directed DNA polymerase, eukaryota, reverse transcriptase zinc-binding domain protein n=1 Tax=Tanacetum cinerariifolium TaxID=118510 RepID=A0A6L2LWQ0_TANCI|nr:RNA-directed DNA polymerase, eukaryota, reverse transcriptase zinc-binding domain protein [Tanacetum cinerariifolium]
MDNKLTCIPTEFDVDGSEFVIFDEEIVKQGSKKWEFTMVNGKPMFVQKWDPSVCLDRAEPNKLPILVNLRNLPLEAWSNKGISAISSWLRTPLIMDKVTTNMRKMGSGGVCFARVLIEVEAEKGLPNSIDIVYKDGDNVVIENEEDDIVKNKDLKDEDSDSYEEIFGSACKMAQNELQCSYRVRDSIKAEWSKEFNYQRKSKYLWCIRNKAKRKESEELVIKCLEDETGLIMLMSVRVLKKIDRVIGSEEFLEIHSKAHVVFLAYGIYDHSPVVLTCPQFIRVKQRHGFFKGWRELRYGDPMSPYLFTLVMEVFNLILQQKSKKITTSSIILDAKDNHMSFADDLLVLCHGDVNSVKLIKKASDSFSEVSGLYPNLGESTISYGSMERGDIVGIMQILPFKSKKLPVRYLEQYQDLDEMSFEEAIGRLTAYEERIKNHDTLEANDQDKLLMASSNNKTYGKWRGKDFNKEGKEGMKWKNNPNARRASTSQGTKDKSKLRCYECGEHGHFVKECTKRKTKQEESHLIYDTDTEPTLL